MKNLKLIVLFIFSVSFVFPQKKESNADLSCFNSPPQLPDLSEATYVSLNDEINAGNQVYNEINKKYKIITSGERLEKADRIMKKIIKQIEKFENPTSHRNFNKYTDQYKIYILDSEEINAFTAGAKIYVTTGIYDFCKNDDELACIIGHEISHNELGHIYKNIRRAKFAESIPFGNLAYSVGTVFTAPFNQVDEGHSDLFGIDLAVSAGFDGCKNITLWERMNENSEGKNIFDLLSSHPYSGDRASCSKEHLKKNYKMNCGK